MSTVDMFYAVCLSFSGLCLARIVIFSLEVFFALQRVLFAATGKSDSALQIYSCCSCCRMESRFLVWNISHLEIDIYLISLINRRFSTEHMWKKSLLCLHSCVVCVIKIQNICYLLLLNNSLLMLMQWSAGNAREAKAISFFANTHTHTITLLKPAIKCGCEIETQCKR